jgi:hypothetical protein
MDASALLDPRKYIVASSSKSALTHNVSRSIDGPTAARRLLHGKKAVLVEARKRVNHPSPIVLTGHTVPHQLLQHYIDMGDELLKFYGPDAEEISFHNYHQQHSLENRGRNDPTTNYYSHYYYPPGSNNNPNGNNKVNPVALPLHVRVRRKDGNNVCLNPPSTYKSKSYDSRRHVSDWNHHLELFLTVMEKFTNPFDKMFQIDISAPTKKNTQEEEHNSMKSMTTTTTTTAKPPPIDKYREDDNDFTSSSLLYPSHLPPRWNVGILRGSYYDIGTVQPGEPESNDDQDEEHGTIPNGFDDVPPLPIVEFVQQPGSKNLGGHILVRLQGIPKPNRYFGTEPQQHRPLPVTLVFDAGYYRNRPSSSTVTSFDED